MVQAAENVTYWASRAWTTQAPEQKPKEMGMADLQLDELDQGRGVLVGIVQNLCTESHTT